APENVVAPLRGQGLCWPDRHQGPNAAPRAGLGYDDAAEYSGLLASEGETIMSTRVRWLGHACLLIESDGRKILIDPFLTGNPAASAKAEDVPADFILISHGHADHVGDAVAIAKRTGATVIANYEIAGWLQKQGLAKVHGQQHGGSHAFPFGRVKLTLAFHG